MKLTNIPDPFEGLPDDHPDVQAAIKNAMPLLRTVMRMSGAVGSLNIGLLGAESTYFDLANPEDPKMGSVYVYVMNPPTGKAAQMFFDAIIRPQSMALLHSMAANHRLATELRKHGIPIPDGSDVAGEGELE